MLLLHVAQAWSFVLSYLHHVRDGISRHQSVGAWPTGKLENDDRRLLLNLSSNVVCNKCTEDVKHNPNPACSTSAPLKPIACRET